VDSIFAAVGLALPRIRAPQLPAAHPPPPSRSPHRAPA
jgi:hypothetical protein